MRRFEASYRVRIFVDRESDPAPKNVKNIEDIFPVIGHKTDLDISSSYFQNCDRYYAKQQMLDIYKSATLTLQTEALPHWI
jgi:hypothetical protein